MNVDKFGRYTYTGMTIDKFGRHTSRERLRGPKGEGFKTTDDGSYNIDSRRLANVADPVKEHDGVNFQTLQSYTNPCLKLNTDSFDAQHKRISNTDDPIEDGDVVTKQYLRSKIPIRLDPTKSYSFHQHRIQDVAAPVDDGDAVNLRFVKSMKRVGKPRTNVDAVNLEYFKGNTIFKSGNDFSADNKRITKLAKPRDLDDAVSKRYLKTVLSELGYVVYQSVNKGRAAMVSKDMWKEKVLESTWEELFN